MAFNVCKREVLFFSMMGSLDKCAKNPLKCPFNEDKTLLTHPR